MLDHLSHQRAVREVARKVLFDACHGHLVDVLVHFLELFCAQLVVVLHLLFSIYRKLVKF